MHKIFNKFYKKTTRSYLVKICKNIDTLIFNRISTTSLSLTYATRRLERRELSRTPPKSSEINLTYPTCTREWDLWDNPWTFFNLCNQPSIWLLICSYRPFGCNDFYISIGLTILLSSWGRRKVKYTIADNVFIIETYEPLNKKHKWWEYDTCMNLMYEPM